VIALVLRSFAGHAPSGTHLVIKNHPLDAGLFAHRRLVERLSTEFDVRSRVHYVETAHLPTLLAHARGTVVVNSTVGMSALSQHCPTKALAQPFYDMPGLTSRAPIDLFWRHPEPPDAALHRALHDTVIHTTQVNGDFVTRRGMALAGAGCERMFDPVSPLERLIRRHGMPDEVRAGPRALAA
jgi:capsular polysaccharide export protein